MRRLFGGIALGAVLLTGCGSDNAGQQASPTTVATTTTLPAAGAPLFLAEVTQSGLGDKDLADPTTRNVVVELGNITCEGVGDFGYGRAVQGILESDAKPTPEEASTFVKSAVNNLCPQYKDLLP
jgi:hypothetical protein